MNDSLVPPLSYKWSNDLDNSMGVIAQEICTIMPETITGNVTIASGMSSSTFTISNGASSGYYNTGATMTINSTGSVGIGSTAIGGAGVSFSWKNEEFVDCLPDISRLQKMCEQYPGLKIAFEKFKTTYHLVKDHYDTPEDQRPKP